MVEFLNGVLGFITGCVFLFIIGYGIYKLSNYLDIKYGLSYNTKNNKTLLDTIEYIFGSSYFVDFKFNEKLLILDMKIFSSIPQETIKTGLENIRNVYFEGENIELYVSDRYLFVYFSDNVRKYSFNFEKIG